jgi:ABC-type sugar transport system substrate-binding protein
VLKFSQNALEMATHGHISLHLTEASNHYQQQLKSDAAAAASRAGYRLEVSFSHLGVVKQIQQLFASVQAPANARPRAIVVLPARDGTLDDVAREAARSKIAWVLLNRRAAALGSLPREFPAVPIFTVTPDDRHIGEIQGQQLRSLLPSGGRVLYVRGAITTATAVEREQGVREALGGSGVELEVVEGGWTLDGARRGVELWLRTARSGQTVDAIACQNDEMAVGALRALDMVASELDRPELLRARILGCDGLPAAGRLLVDEKKLTATVSVPSTGGVAIDLLVRSLDSGVKPPLETLVPCGSYPSLESLVRRSKPPSFLPNAR